MADCLWTAAAQNLPVQTVRAMGADVIIAVDLGTTTPTDSELANPLGIAQQMVNILVDLNVYASRDALKPGDVLISPKVQGFSSGDFGRGTELVPIGEKAAREMQGKLAALSLSPAQYASFREAQQARSMARSKGARVAVDASQLRHVNPRVREGASSLRMNAPAHWTKLGSNMRSVDCSARATTSGSTIATKTRPTASACW